MAETKTKKTKIIKAENINSTSISSEYKTFIKKLLIITLFLFWIYFFIQIKNIIIIFLFSVFLNLLFFPLLNKFNKAKIHDVIWMIIIYIFLIVFVLILVFAILPIFIKQFSNLYFMFEWYLRGIADTYRNYWIEWLNIPPFLQWYLENFDFTNIFNAILDNISAIWTFVGNNLKSFLSSGIGLISSIWWALANFLLVFIFTFFMALERHNIREFFYKVMPRNVSSYVLSKEWLITSSIWNWFKWQTKLWVFIFIITYVALTILSFFGIDLEHNFTLALIAWMMEFIPYLWPILSALPAIAIALWMSYKAAIIIIIIYVIIQQIENNLLVPFVMSKNLRLSPFAVLIAMTIWATVFWIVWIIVAVPIVAIAQIFLKDYIDRK